MKFERDTTRQDWYTSEIMDFLEDESATEKHIDLYHREARKIERDFPVFVTLGDRLLTDKRYACTVTRKTINN